MRLMIWLLAVLPAIAQTPSWQMQTVTGTAPYHRAWTRLVYDPVQHVALSMLHDTGTVTNPGGRTIYSDSLWAYDPAKKTWEQKTNSGVTTDCFSPNGSNPAGHPAPRHPYHALAYDTSRGKMGLFGGVCDGIGYSDTWMYTSGANTWANPAPSSPPASRWEDAMVYDSLNDVFVLYGGLDQSHSGSISNETWHYAPSTNTWTNITYTGTPPAVSEHGLIYDSVNHKVILVTSPAWGGPASTQTWLYDAATHAWTNPNPANQPANVVFPSMAFDTRRARLTYYAGPSTMYTYDVAANTWATLSVSGGPAMVDGVGGECNRCVTMAYDSDRDKFILTTVNGGGGVDVYELALSTTSALSVPLIVQEAIYPGVTGVSRTNEPVTVGVPLKDSDAIGSGVQAVSVNGSSYGQFRCLGVWPSGNCKWTLVDAIVPTLTAGGTSTALTVVGGNGNYGGAYLGTDNGTTITVATGTATFTVKKAAFNLIDSATVGATTIVSSSAASGLFLSGPTPGNTTCGTCTTVYSSVNDASSTATLEENGPVKAVVKATGALKDGSGNVYMRFTARLFFYKNKNYARLKVELRNADQSPAVYRGYASFEARLALAPTAATFAFGGRTGTVSGTYSGSEDAYIYQKYSNFQQGGDWNSSVPGENNFSTIMPRSAGGGCSDAFCYPDNTRTDEGYVIKQGVTTLESGTRSQYPTGWGDVASSGGVGVLAGFPYMAGYWPKSIEYKSGGAQLVLGISPSQNPHGYNQAWPQYQITDAVLEFHATALSSPANTFTNLQHNLLARASTIGYYNDTGVFPYTLPTATEEDAYYESIEATSNPSISAYGTGQCCISDFAPSITRFYGWSAGGGANQADFRWAYQLHFLSRGLTGRYLWAQHFYRFISEAALARSDFAGGWRGSGASLNPSLGYPGANPTNSGLGGLRDWIEQSGEHSHVYGIFDWYYATGDESLKDAISQGIYDRFLNASSTLNDGTGLWNSRAVGVELMNISRLHDYLVSLGDTANAAVAYTVAEAVLDTQVRATLSTPGYVAGDIGTDRNRGMHYGCCDSITWDNPPASSGPNGAGSARNSGVMQHSLLIEGIYEYLKSRGTSWSGYEDLADIAYGMYSWVRDEMTVPATSWSPPVNGGGLRYYNAIDYCNGSSPCTGSSHSQMAPQTDHSTVYMPWFWDHEYTGDTSWAGMFQVMLNGVAAQNSGNWSENATYTISSTVYKALHPTTKPTLRDVAFSLTNLGGGSYRLTFTPPTGTTNLKVKWGLKRLKESLGFDPMTALSFTYSPSTYQTWWSATNVADEPAPTPGVQQTYDVTGTGNTGLTAANFSVKAYAPAGGGSTVRSGGNLRSGGRVN